MENEEQEIVENTRRIAGLNSGLADRCDVLECPEHWRCLDIDNPQRCAVFRMYQKKQEERRRRTDRERLRRQRAKDAKTTKAEGAALPKPAPMDRNASREERIKHALAIIKENTQKPYYIMEVATGRKVSGGIREAADVFGCACSTVSTEARKKDGKYIYVDEDGERIYKLEKMVKRGNRPVLDLELDVVYPSVSIAAAVYGVNASTMTCNVKKGKRFRYADE